LHFQFDPVISPIPCAPIDPSQQLLEYVLVSQHKQARELPLGLVLLPMYMPLFFGLFLFII